jgi:hypothetical protein
VNGFGRFTNVPASNRRRVLDVFCAEQRVRQNPRLDEKPQLLFLFVCLRFGRLLRRGFLVYRDDRSGFGVDENLSDIGGARCRYVE